jgi:hypothetical protein
MLLSASPVFGSVGVLGIALGVCLVLLFVIRAQRAEIESRQSDAIEDMTYRLRHPARWTAAHPFQALRRKLAR